MCISRERNRSLREKGRALKVCEEYIGTMKMGSWRFSVFSLFLIFNFLRFFFSILWNNLIWKFMEMCQSENAKTKFIKKNIGENLVMAKMVFLYSDKMVRVACPLRSPFILLILFFLTKIIPLIVTWLKRWRCLIWTHSKVGPMQYYNPTSHAYWYWYLMAHQLRNIQKLLIILFLPLFILTFDSTLFELHDMIFFNDIWLIWSFKKATTNIYI